MAKIPSIRPTKALRNPILGSRKAQDKSHSTISNSYNSKPWIGLSLICALTFFGLVGTLFSYKKGHITSPELSVINTPPLAATSYSPAPNKPISEEKLPRDRSFWPKRITVQRVEEWPKKRCLERDYTSLEVMFATNYRVGKVFPILDLRGHRFDDNTYAANIGIAGRYVPSPNSRCRIIGMNLYYDFRDGHKGHYHQIGLGFESLGRRWDVRANGYIPISSLHKTKCVFDQYIGNFFAIRRDYEFAFYGINAEVGYYFVRGRNFLLYAAAGPYYFTRRSQGFNSLGGEFRIRPQYKDYLAVDLSVRHDSIFGTIYQAKAILYLPLYQLSKNLKKRPCGISDQQIYQPIERFEIIPLRRRTCWKTNF